MNFFKKKVQLADSKMKFKEINENINVNTINMYYENALSVYQKILH